MRMIDRDRDDANGAGADEREVGPDGLSRRQFLTGVAAATGALALSACGGGGNGGSSGGSTSLPDPESSGIEHVVVVMMENRSFDHFLGWLPGADGRQSGLRFADKSQAMQTTFGLAPNFQNCQFEDPDHSYEGGRQQFNDGKCDGWLQAGTNDNFPLGYYTQSDLALYGQAVPQWTTFDRYFCSILGPTYPNRLYMHLGQTDRLTNTLDTATVPKIWDQLADNGLTGKYYYSDLPITALLGAQYRTISKSIGSFIQDAAAGTLPNVSFVDPKFFNESAGTSEDDHPLADIRNGQAFVSKIYQAVTTGAAWDKTVLVVTYDEWGGFFDHVPPPMAPQTDLDPQIGNDGRLGFRVPTLLVSPFARRGFVDHTQYDHTSILKLISWRWGLEPLTVRVDTANNLAEALDFSKPNLAAPQYSVPAGPFGGACPETSAAAAARLDMQLLRAHAIRSGYSVAP
jgi:phospholipase C